MTEYTIDEEFRDLLPSTPRETDEALERMILAEGRVRNPIHVWKGILIDGQRRYQVASKHGIPFEVIHLDHLPDRDAVKQWMLEDFRTRRSASQAEVRQHLARRLQKMKPKDGNQRRPDVHAAEAVAQDSGVSERTVYRAAKLEGLIDNLAPEIAERIRESSVEVSEESLARLAELEIADQHEVLDYQRDEKYDKLGTVLHMLFRKKDVIERTEYENKPVYTPKPEKKRGQPRVPPKPYLDYLGQAQRFLANLLDQLVLARRADDTDGAEGRLDNCREHAAELSKSIAAWKEF